MGTGETIYKDMAQDIIQVGCRCRWYIMSWLGPVQYMGQVVDIQDGTHPVVEGKDIFGHRYRGEWDRTALILTEREADVVFS